MADEEPPRLPAPTHTRVFVSSGGWFALPPDAYAAVRLVAWA